MILYKSTGYNLNSFVTVCMLMMNPIMIDEFAHLFNCTPEDRVLDSMMIRLTAKRSHLSRVMRKQTFCICENKSADQLRGNSEADQRLCFRYIDSTITLLSKSEISSI